MKTMEIKNVADMTGKELVEQYNQLAKELKRPPVKKFRDLNTGRERLRNISQDWAEYIEQDTIRELTNELAEDEENLLITELRPRRKVPAQETLDPVTKEKAKKLGYVLYWDGNRCDNGHASPRYTSDGKCKICYREYKAGARDCKSVSQDKN